jgi:hypothetical protein
MPKSPNKPSQNNKMLMIVISAILAITILSGLGYFGYHTYTTNRQERLAQEQVEKDRIQANNDWIMSGGNTKSSIKNEPVKINVNETLTFLPPKIDPVKLVTNPCYALSYTSLNIQGVNFLNRQGLAIRIYAKKVDGIKEPTISVSLADPQKLYDAGKITKEEQSQMEKNNKEQQELTDLYNKNIWVQYVNTAKSNYLNSTVRDKNTSCFDSALNL